MVRPALKLARLDDLFPGQKQSLLLFLRVELHLPPSRRVDVLTHLDLDLNLLRLVELLAPREKLLDRSGTELDKGVRHAVFAPLSDGAGSTSVNGDELWIKSERSDMKVRQREANEPPCASF